MFRFKNLILVVTILVLLAAPILAAEGGSAKFVVTRNMYVAGTEIKAGAYEVKWEPSDKSAAVTFARIGKTEEIKVQGKLEEVAKKYDFNSVAIGKDSAGREAIIQLQFSGKSIRIVFE